MKQFYPGDYFIRGQMHPYACVYIFPSCVSQNLLLSLYIFHLPPSQNRIVTNWSNANFPSRTIFFRAIKGNLEIFIFSQSSSVFLAKRQLFILLVRGNQTKWLIERKTRFCAGFTNPVFRLKVDYTDAYVIPAIIAMHSRGQSFSASGLRLFQCGFRNRHSRSVCV